MFCTRPCSIQGDQSVLEASINFITEKREEAHIWLPWSMRARWNPNSPNSSVLFTVPQQDNLPLLAPIYLIASSPQPLPHTRFSHSLFNYLHHMVLHNWMNLGTSEMRCARFTRQALKTGFFYACLSLSLTGIESHIPRLVALWTVLETSFFPQISPTRLGQCLDRRKSEKSLTNRMF